MVSISTASDEASVQLVAGLSEADAKRVLNALEFVRPLYSGNPVATGQDAFVFSESVAVTLASLKTDAETRIAGLLFELPIIDAKADRGTLWRGDSRPGRSHTAADAAA
jgi:GTP pyrophosphokinase